MSQGNLLRSESKNHLINVNTVNDRYIKINL